MFEIIHSFEKISKDKTNDLCVTLYYGFLAHICGKMRVGLKGDDPPDK